MYELGPRLPDVSVDDGTNLLLSGAPMTGKHALALDVLAHGSRNGEGAIVVTTQDDADRVLQEYHERVDDTPPLGVVDCVTRQQGLDTTPAESESVRFASSPDDLTGIGIELSELLRTFYADRNLDRNRVLLDSLSTLLMYTDLQTVFRFLHVFTGRVQSVDALGLFTIDATAHEQQTMSTLKQLFDGVVEVAEHEGESRHRVVGLPDVDSAWHET